MRHFELLGLPGSGKSTVTRHWAPHDGVWSMRQLWYRERMQTAARHRRRLVRILPATLQVRVVPHPQPSSQDPAAFIVGKPELHRLVLDAAQEIPALDDRRLAVGMLFEAWGDHGYADRVGPPTGGVLLDEGSLQRLVYLLAVAGAARSPEVLRPEHVAGLHGVVVLDVPGDLAARRLQARGCGFQAVDLLAPMAVLIDAAVEALRAAEVPVAVVAAEGDPAAVRQQVQAVVAGWMRT